MTKHKLLVTGANGFVGQAVCARLSADGREFREAVRSPAAAINDACIVVGEIGSSTDWSAALEGCDAVLHLAARVHVMEETAADPLSEFRRVNVDGTLALAQQAAAAKVRRFVYVSTVKVNGEETFPGHPFTVEDAPAPADAYAVSKHEAELALQRLCAETGMELVIVRPPLVYGPGVKANFASMMRWIARGRPLPLACITRNRRSLVAVDNLVDFLRTCVDHPAAAGQTFLVSDGDDMSTADLLSRMGIALERPARLIPVPEALLRVGSRLVGRPDIAQRLCGSLQVDIGHACRTLDWYPPVSVTEAFRRTAAVMSL